MKKIGIAIIGCGEISAQTAIAFAGIKEYKLEYFVDMNIDAAEDLSAEFGGKATTNMDDALEDSCVNAVYIATPHFLHVKHACSAAEKGKHLFIEKPIAIKDEDAQKIIETAEKNGVKCTVMFTNRYFQHSLLAKQLIEDGVIGKVITIQHTYMQDRREIYFAQGVSGQARPSDWRQLREKAGGGNLIMNGAHTVDLMMWMTGLNAIRVYGEMDTFVHNIEVEDMLCSTLRFDNGAIGTIDIGTAAIGKGSNLFTIFGDKGQVDIPDFWADSIKLFTLNKESDYKTDEWHELEVDASVNGRAALLKDALTGFKEHGSFPISAKDGAKCQKVINGIYSSALSHKAVELY